MATIRASESKVRSHAPALEHCYRREPRLVRGLAAIAWLIVAPIACAGQQVVSASGKWLALSLDPSSTAACGATSAGAVACWSVGGTAGERSELLNLGSLQHPHVVPKVNHAVGVAVAESFACAWTVIGEVWCWGTNDAAQLGDSTHVSRDEPRRVHTRVFAAQVGVSGDGFACLLSREGRAYCWGSGLYGRINPATVNGGVVVPTPVAGEHQFKAISVGSDSHVCAIDHDGIVWCWGENGAGQVSAAPTPGIDSIPESTYIRVPVGVQPAHRFAHIASGNSFTCALDIEGATSCWGGNGDASLGVGDTKDHAGVQAVRTSEKFISIDAGFRWTCGTTSASRLVCWGLRDVRQNPVGSSRLALPTPFPQQRGSLSGIAIGGYGSCVLDRAGTIRCWNRASR
jgi:alpha-tubulin suppressor-like RCC1 family protein